MSKMTIDDYRQQYRDATHKEPAIRWNKKTIQKKIALFKTEQAFDNSDDKKNKSVNDISSPKPDFEKLIDGNNDKNLRLGDADVPKSDGRGGYREGAGRPSGQTEERARVERLMKLEVPDLAVKKLVQGLNIIFHKFTPLAFTPDQVDRVSLGITLPLYYWFPAIEGVTNKWTLHLQALEYIGSAFAERALMIKQIEQEKQNVEIKKELAGESPESTGNSESSGDNTCGDTV